MRVAVLEKGVAVEQMREDVELVREEVDEKPMGINKRAWAVEREVGCGPRATAINLYKCNSAGRI